MKTMIFLIIALALSSDSFPRPTDFESSKDIMNAHSKIMRLGDEFAAEKTAANEIVERLRVGEDCDSLCDETTMLVERIWLHKEIEEWEEVKQKYGAIILNEDDVAALNDQIKEITDFVKSDSFNWQEMQDVGRSRLRIERKRKKLIKLAKEKTLPKFRRIQAIRENLSDSGSSASSFSDGSSPMMRFRSLRDIPLGLSRSPSPLLGYGSSSSSRSPHGSRENLSSLTDFSEWNYPAGEHSPQSTGAILHILVERLRNAPIHVARDILMSLLRLVLGGRLDRFEWLLQRLAVVPEEESPETADFASQPEPRPTISFDPVFVTIQEP